APSVNDRYLVVSSDSHAGPSLERDLRPYCPERYLPDFDAFARRAREGLDHVQAMFLASRDKPYMGGREAFDLTANCPGQSDPHARLRDMDDSGIAAEVVFAGGQNGEVLPFVGTGWGAGTVDVSPELRAVGEQIWNRWLCDFVSPAPGRL